MRPVCLLRAVLPALPGGCPRPDTLLPPTEVPLAVAREGPAPPCSALCSTTALQCQKTWLFFGGVAGAVQLAARCGPQERSLPAFALAGSAAEFLGFSR